MTLGPFTTKHYPNLPAQQHEIQRIAAEINAADAKRKQAAALRAAAWSELITAVFA